MILFLLGLTSLCVLMYLWFFKRTQTVYFILKWNDYIVENFSHDQIFLPKKDRDSIDTSKQPLIISIGNGHYTTTFNDSLSSKLVQDSLKNIINMNPKNGLEWIFVTFMFKDQPFIFPATVNFIKETYRLLPYDYWNFELEDSILGVIDHNGKDITSVVKQWAGPKGNFYIDIPEYPGIQLNQYKSITVLGTNYKNFTFEKGDTIIIDPAAGVF